MRFASVCRENPLIVVSRGAMAQEVMSFGLLIVNDEMLLG